MSKKNKIICLCGAFVLSFFVCLVLYIYPVKTANKSIIDEYMQEYDPDTYEPIYPPWGQCH